MQYKNVGKFLRKKRKDCGYTLQAFAKKAGIQSATLCRAEINDQDIRICWLAKVAQGFGISLAKLIKEYETSDFVEKVMVK